MGNIDTTIDSGNSDIITIDISGITTLQRSYLKKCINYQDSVDDGMGGTMANPIPLIAALLADSMAKRIEEIEAIIKQEAANTAVTSAETTIATVLSTLM